MGGSRRRVAIGLAGSVIAHVAVAAGILLLPMRSVPLPVPRGTATITDATRGIPGGPPSRRKDEREQPIGLGTTAPIADARTRPSQPGTIRTPSVLATAVRIAGESVRTAVAPVEAELSPHARWLLRHLWESTVFAAGIWLLTVLLRRASARIRYWMWVGASLKFVVPLSWLEGSARVPASPRAFDALSSLAAAPADGTWLGLLVRLAVPVWLVGMVAVLIVRRVRRQGVRESERPGAPGGAKMVARLQLALEALFWFHPVVWWIGSHLRAERERAAASHPDGTASLRVPL